MTSTLVHLDPAAELHACLDRVDAVDVEALDHEGTADLLRALTRAEARVAAKKLQLLACAERRRTASRSGAASTGQWAARLANADQVVAQRQVSLATGLERRGATRRALSAGEISAEHAAVIVHADRQLPARVTLEQRVVVERALVEKARVLSPGSLRKAARRALAAVEADVAVVDAHEHQIVSDQEAHARARTRLSLHDNDDGTVTGHFTIPVLQGHLLRKILETITAPRRARVGATRAQSGHSAVRSLGADWDRARGEAFCELLEHLPTDHLHPKTAATLVVTVGLDTLRGTLKVARLDTDETITAGEARRLACNSRLLPVVLGGASLPLDLGRSARLFTEAQRTALGTRHTTCAADGCERPFAWTELHHREPWTRHGPTDLDNAIPLCRFHHQRIHDQHYEHAETSDGSIAFRERC
ncbi:HNH endonuclease [Nocardioides marmoriginsengisoli]|uniref:HNH endonuclease n=1 Tax=Nocardioides marmoriginsengisoli TaxID=661483 RepID=A0A3N0CNH8_9ACTN|nr:HNH endonuclease signature motif containing protein [Nocardioides marmoriginsengisoli]RNL65022.1 HNH endonuclease [Nocardioides marmoriginsengisoli]